MNISLPAYFSPPQGQKVSIATLVVLLSVLGCTDKKDSKEHEKLLKVEQNQFVTDIQFLKQHVDTIVLEDPQSGAAVAVVPAWQGRVMTATTGQGESFGWLNNELIASGIQPENERDGLTRHIYAFGGADRFWIGPEGGQFSWYFEPNTEFNFENWKVPAFIDTEAWKVTSTSLDNVTFERQQTLKNWSRNDFKLGITRKVSLLSKKQIETRLSTTIPDNLNFVGYESQNQITNNGETAWTTETGMPSVWILGMLKHGPETTVVIPYEKPLKNESSNFEIVKDDYFGKVPGQRLKINPDAGVIYFSADGEFRSKIGISHERSLGIAGSWDALNETLTIVQYNQPEGQADYVNSSWQLQSTPFVGDAINSYNDGPVDGGILGPFYEIETSSPALALAPGESYNHAHRTFHLGGKRQSLEQIAKDIFGVSLTDIEQGLSH